MAQPELNTIAALFLKHFGYEATSIVPLQAHASNRQRFRIFLGMQSYIGIFSENVKETESFLYLSKLFASQHLPVPTVMAITDDKQCYIENDLGKETLFDWLQSDRMATNEIFSERAMAVYKKTLSLLLKFQIKVAPLIDFSKAYPFPSFDARSMLIDLQYFERDFLSRTTVPSDSRKLDEAMRAFVQATFNPEEAFFMHRDFQARNIMVKQDEIFFIDFQGGRKGPLQYDVASFLYQAKAKLPQMARDQLLNYYAAELESVYHIPREGFLQRFPSILFLRFMQVLGTYGAQGLGQGKAYFRESIPLALENVKDLLPKVTLPDELKSVINEMLDRFYAGVLFHDA